MSWITVFLNEANAHTAIPMHFVHDLNDVTLKNRGVNSNQNRLIYFSSELFDGLINGEIQAPSDYITNFDLPITKMYPLPDGLRETCFVGRLKKFWGECRKKLICYVQWN